MALKDKKISIKYIAKSNMVISNNYYNAIIGFGFMGAALFFMNATIIMGIIGVLMLPLYLYLYKSKNKNIITSVTVYQYHTIFMEILFKSWKIDKAGINDIKKIFNKKK